MHNKEGHAKQRPYTLFADELGNPGEFDALLEEYTSVAMRIKQTQNPELESSRKNDTISRFVTNYEHTGVSLIKTALHSTSAKQRALKTLSLAYQRSPHSAALELQRAVTPFLVNIIDHFTTNLDRLERFITPTATPKDAFKRFIQILFSFPMQLLELVKHADNTEYDVFDKFNGLDHSQFKLFVLCSMESELIFMFNEYTDPATKYAETLLNNHGEWSRDPMRDLLSQLKTLVEQKMPHLSLLRCYNDRQRNSGCEVDAVCTLKLMTVGKSCYSSAVAQLANQDEGNFQAYGLYRMMDLYQHHSTELQQEYKTALGQEISNRLSIIQQFTEEQAYDASIFNGCELTYTFDQLEARVEYFLQERPAACRGISIDHAAWRALEEAATVVTMPNELLETQRFWVLVEMLSTSKDTAKEIHTQSGSLPADTRRILTALEGKMNDDPQIPSYNGKEAAPDQEKQANHLKAVNELYHLYKNSQQSTAEAGSSSTADGQQLFLEEQIQAVRQPVAPQSAELAASEGVSQESAQPQVTTNDERSAQLESKHDGLEDNRAAAVGDALPDIATIMENLKIRPDVLTPLLNYLRQWNSGDLLPDSLYADADLVLKLLPYLMNEDDMPLVRTLVAGYINPTLDAVAGTAHGAAHEPDDPQLGKEDRQEKLIQIAIIRYKHTNRRDGGRLERIFEGQILKEIARINGEHHLSHRDVVNQLLANDIRAAFAYVEGMDQPAVNELIVAIKDDRVTLPEPQDSEPDFSYYLIRSRQGYIQRPEVGAAVVSQQIGPSTAANTDSNIAKFSDALIGSHGIARVAQSYRAHKEAFGSMDHDKIAKTLDAAITKKETDPQAGHSCWILGTPEELMPELVHCLLATGNPAIAERAVQSYLTVEQPAGHAALEAKDQDHNIAAPHPHPGTITPEDRLIKFVLDSYKAQHGRQGRQKPREAEILTLMANRISDTESHGDTEQHTRIVNKLLAGDIRAAFAYVAEMDQPAVVALIDAIENGRVELPKRADFEPDFSYYLIRSRQVYDENDDIVRFSRALIVSYGFEEVQQSYQNHKNDCTNSDQTFIERVLAAIEVEQIEINEDFRNKRLKKILSSYDQGDTTRNDQLLLLILKAKYPQTPQPAADEGAVGVSEPLLQQNGPTNNQLNAYISSLRYNDLFTVAEKSSFKSGSIKTAIAAVISPILAGGAAAGTTAGLCAAGVITSSLLSVATGGILPVVIAAAALFALIVCGIVALVRHCKKQSKINHRKGILRSACVPADNADNADNNQIADPNHSI